VKSKKIIVDGKGVRGIRLKDGFNHPFPEFISTIDIKLTMEDLVGLDILRALNPGYAAKLDSVLMTTSTFTVNLGID